MICTSKAISRSILLALVPSAALCPTAMAQPFDGSIVQPVNVTSSYDQVFGDNLGGIRFTFDQSGLLAPYVSGETDFDTYIATTFHRNTNSGMMLVNSNGLNQPNGVVNVGGTITIDFGAALPIDALGVWATRSGAELMSRVALYSDTDADPSNGVSALLGEFSIPATGAGTPLEFPAVETRFVHIKVLVHGGGDFLRNGEFAARIASSETKALLSNVPAADYDGITSVLGDLEFIHGVKAVGFTTGDGRYADLTITAMINNPASVELDLFGGVHANQAGDPGDQIAAFAPVPVAAGANNLPVTLTLADPSFELAPNTKYWIVLDGEANTDTVLRWLSSNAGSAPTPWPGIAFDGFRISNSGGASWTNSTAFDALSVNARSVEAAPCSGDVDGDSDVDSTDLSLLLTNFGVLSGATLEDGDVDGDSDVDSTDLSLLLTVFGSACP